VSATRVSKDKPENVAGRANVPVSSSPTVTSSGHMVWSIRDILFSESRKAAGEALTRSTQPASTEKK